MNTEPTTSETSVDIAACSLLEQCGNISKRIAEIQEMIETIRQANRKGYPDIVRDHAGRIFSRFHHIDWMARVATMDAEKLAK